MPYERMPGRLGLIYVPPKNDTRPKKHPCADCFDCQWCGDTRCASCRGTCKVCNGPDTEKTASSE